MTWSAKLFSWIIILVTFGAGTFHLLATYAPALIHFLDPLLDEISWLVWVLVSMALAASLWALHREHAAKNLDARQ